MSDSGLPEQLERMLDGLSGLEKALVLASALGEVYGFRWKIEAKDGGFSITQALPEEQKTL